MSEKKHNYQIPAIKVDTKVVDGEWLERLKAQSWWQHDNIQTPDMYLSGWNSTRDQLVLIERWNGFKRLHDILLSIGGSETCFPDVEEDMAKILERGRYYGGFSKMMKGKPSRCHENACNLWTANKDKHDVHIATGYALSADGMWRQHSWLVQRYQTATQHRTRIVETTEKRVAYFGFEMTEDEANEFCYYNYM